MLWDWTSFQPSTKACCTLSKSFSRALRACCPASSGVRPKARAVTHSPSLTAHVKFGGQSNVPVGGTGIFPSHFLVGADVLPTITDTNVSAAHLPERV